MWGQFHDAKKCVITYGLLIAIYKFQIFLHILKCKLCL